MVGDENNNVSIPVKKVIAIIYPGFTVQIRRNKNPTTLAAKFHSAVINNPESFTILFFVHKFEAIAW